MRQSEVEIDGQIVSYYESSGTGKPILCIHGNSLSGLCSQRQLESPLGEQYRLVALDLPGHGSSEAASTPELTYTLPGYSALLVKFISKLGIDDALMVGWSLGGHILLEAAELLDKAAGFMIFGTPPLGYPMAGDAFKPNPLFSCLFTKELSSGNAAAVAASFFSSEAPVPELFTEAMLETDGSARTALWQSVAEGNYTDEITVVASLNKPLAIVHGESDRLVNLDYIQQLSIPTLWRGGVQVITNAGHATHWEQPQAFNQLLSGFMNDCIVS